MKKCLIIVDYQNDFVDGSLGFEGAELLDERITKRIEKAIHDKEDIIFTLDTHNEDYLNTEEGNLLPVKHCVRGTFGHEIYGKTKAYMQYAKKIYEKPTFPSIDLGNDLRKESYDEVELCGLVSNICVLSNAVIVKSALPNAKIFVNKKLTDSADRKRNEEAFDIMDGLHIHIIDEV